MKYLTSKKIFIGLILFICVITIFYVAGIIGGNFSSPFENSNTQDLQRLVPKEMHPTPIAMEACANLYALSAPRGVQNPRRKHYTQQQFDQLLTFVFYPDKNPYDWVVNVGALGALLSIDLPKNDVAFRMYEVNWMTKAATTFIKNPQPAVRWDAAYLIERQRLTGTLQSLSAALLSEKNPLVAKEMRKALNVCNKTE